MGPPEVEEERVCAAKRGETVRGLDWGEERKGLKEEGHERRIKLHWEYVCGKRQSQTTEK